MKQKTFTVGVTLWLAYFFFVFHLLKLTPIGACSADSRHNMP